MFLNVAVLTNAAIVFCGVITLNSQNKIAWFSMTVWLTFICIILVLMFSLHQFPQRKMYLCSFFSLVLKQKDESSEKKKKAIKLLIADIHEKIYVVFSKGLVTLAAISQFYLAVLWMVKVAGPCFKMFNWIWVVWLFYKEEPTKMSDFICAELVDGCRPNCSKKQISLRLHSPRWILIFLFAKQLKTIQFAVRLNFVLVCYVKAQWKPLKFGF